MANGKQRSGRLPKINAVRQLTLFLNVVPTYLAEIKTASLQSHQLITTESVCWFLSHVKGLPWNKTGLWYERHGG